MWLYLLALSTVCDVCLTSASSWHGGLRRGRRGALRPSATERPWDARRHATPLESSRVDFPLWRAQSTQVFGRRPMEDEPPHWLRSASHMRLEVGPSAETTPVAASRDFQHHPMEATTLFPPACLSPAYDESAYEDDDDEQDVTDMWLQTAGTISPSPTPYDHHHQHPGEVDPSLREYSHFALDPFSSGTMILQTSPSPVPFMPVAPPVPATVERIHDHARHQSGEQDASRQLHSRASASAGVAVAGVAAVASTSSPSKLIRFLAHHPIQITQCPSDLESCTAASSSLSRFLARWCRSAAARRPGEPASSSRISRVELTKSRTPTTTLLGRYRLLLFFLGVTAVVFFVFAGWQLTYHRAASSRPLLSTLSSFRNAATPHSHAGLHSSLTPSDRELLDEFDPDSHSSHSSETPSGHELLLDPARQAIQRNWNLHNSDALRLQSGRGHSESSKHHLHLRERAERERFRVRELLDEATATPEERTEHRIQRLASAVLFVTSGAHMHDPIHFPFESGHPMRGDHADHPPTVVVKEWQPVAAADAAASSSLYGLDEEAPQARVVVKNPSPSSHDGVVGEESDGPALHASPSPSPADVARFTQSLIDSMDQTWASTRIAAPKKPPPPPAHQPSEKEAAAGNDKAKEAAQQKKVEAEVQKKAAADQQKKAAAAAAVAEQKKAALEQAEAERAAALARATAEELAKYKAKEQAQAEARAKKEEEDRENGPVGMAARKVPRPGSIGFKEVDPMDLPM